MATYLLKAEDEDMDRWKADAAAAGKTFAVHVRERLDAAVPGRAVRRSSARPKTAVDPHFKPDPKSK
jgi:hypothetical protein